VPDLHFAEIRHVVTPGFAVVESMTTGTPVGGKPYEAHIVDLLTIRDGKIAAKRSYRKAVV
jgi:ketosteroid isomerase-like protein